MQAAKEAVALIKRNISTYYIDCGFEETAAYIFSQDEKQSEELDTIQVSATDAGLLVNPVLLLRFFEMEKSFPIKKHCLAHTKKECKRFNLLLTKKYCGITKRSTFFCKNCQVKFA